MHQRWWQSQTAGSQQPDLTTGPVCNVPAKLHCLSTNSGPETARQSDVQLNTHSNMQLTATAGAWLLDPYTYVYLAVILQQLQGDLLGDH